MRRLFDTRHAHVRLGLVFLGLVLVPSLLLGLFSLRAVDSQRQASQRRVLEERQRDATFAARNLMGIVRRLEDTWTTMVPRSIDWPEHVGEIEASLQRAGSRIFVADTWILPEPAARTAVPRGAAAPAPRVAADDTAFARLWRQLDDVEYERGEPATALGLLESDRSGSGDPLFAAMRAVRRGRLWMALDRPAEARAAFEPVWRGPELFDLENQPLRLEAALGWVHATMQLGEFRAAAIRLADAAETLVAVGDALSASQYARLQDRLRRRMVALERAAGELPPPERSRFETAMSRPKPPVGPRGYRNKLARKLVRARLENQPYSTPVRYVTPDPGASPFLLAYLYLPDPRGRHVAGLVGWRVDLARLEAGLLERLAAQMADAGHVFSLRNAAPRTASPAAPREAIVVPLDEPLRFWSLQVTPIPGAIPGDVMDFRTKVYLYLVLMLLLTLAAGATLVGIGLRRQSRLSRMKTDFVSNVSHELRTPLTSIRMYAEMLELMDDRAQGTPEDRRRALQTIRSECDRLQRLIDAVLDFARMERGTQVFHFEYEDPGEVVRSTAESLRPRAEAEGFTYVVDVAENLPEVRMDADAIRQVLVNLVSNAMKYSEDTRWVRVACVRQADGVLLSVEDRGIGIEAADRERIFDDFYRVDTLLSSKRRGVGLGLTLARRIVEAHSGHIEVVSQPGVGSTFRVWLPASPPTDVTSTPRETAEA